MASIPAAFGEIKTSNAVSKLVIVPGRDVAKPSGNTLYDKLRKKSTQMMVDQSYGEAFTRARSLKVKLTLMKEYVRQPEADLNSEWCRDAICALKLEGARIDRTRKSRDPIKKRVAEIKARTPRIPHRDLCRELDSRGIELPERWRQLGNRTWIHAYHNKKLAPRLRSYFSKVKP